LKILKSFLACGNSQNPETSEVIFLSIFTCLPGLQFSRKDLRDLLKNFKDMPPMLGKAPKIEDLQVGYPVIIITPIALYR